MNLLFVCPLCTKLLSCVNLTDMMFLFLFGLLIGYGGDGKKNDLLKSNTWDANVILLQTCILEVMHFGMSLPHKLYCLHILI